VKKEKPIPAMGLAFFVKAFFNLEEGWSMEKQFFIT